LVKILKCVKQLATDHHTRANLRQAGAIKQLIKVLRERDGKLLTIMQSHVLGALQQLCRLHPQTIQQSVDEGVIPHLQHIILTSSNNPLKELAIPLICDLANVKSTRPQLWKYGGVDFYLNLLSKEKLWQMNLLDVLSSWLADETARVEDIMTKPHHIDKLVSMFKSAQNEAFILLLEPLFSTLLASAQVTKALAISQPFLQELIQRLSQPSPQVRLSLLKILMRLYDEHPQPKQMVIEHKLYPVVKGLAHEKTVLVQKMAKKLAGSFKKTLGGKKHLRKGSLTQQVLQRRWIEHH